MKDQNYINILIKGLKLRDTKFNNLQEMREEAKKVGLEKASYEKSHPEIINWEDENQMEARIQYQGENIYSFFENLPPFEGDEDKIPEIPIMPIPFLREKVWPGLIRAGAIPKNHLIPGGKYLGSCRNASKATWDGTVFWYTRQKFGNSYQESIKHFQDDDGGDVFIPIKKL